MVKTTIQNPRWLWITALVVGGVCTIAFVAMWFAPSEPSAPGPTPSNNSGLGFGAGMILGLVAGVAIGFAIARQRLAARDASRDET